MTMVPHFLDETIEKSMNISPKYFEGHKPLVWTQVSNANALTPTIKSCPDKIPYNPNQHYSYVQCGNLCSFSFVEDIMGCDPKLSWRKPKVGTHDTLDQ